MRIFLTTLVLTSAFLAAQEAPTKAPNHDPNPQVSGPNAYQGCVIKSNGKVMLTDSSNKDYILVRNARSTGTVVGSERAPSLESYLGQEVRITATMMNPNDPSLDDSSVHGQKPQNLPATLDVEEIAKVADHCSSPK